MELFSHNRTNGINVNGQSILQHHPMGNGTCPDAVNSQVLINLVCFFFFGTDTLVNPQIGKVPFLNKRIQSIIN